MGQKRWYAALAALVVLIAGAVGVYFWPETFHSTVRSHFPIYETDATRPTLRVPDGDLFATVREFRDEVLAYTVFTYLRDSEAIRPARLFITARVDRGNTVYEIVARFPNDLLTSIPLISQLQVARLLSDSWGIVPEALSKRWEQETELFSATYDLAIQRRLRGVPRTEVMSAVAAYLRSGPTNLPRTRRVSPLRRVFAGVGRPRLVADIVMVAEFYALPLDLFLSIRDLDQSPESAEASADPAADRELTGEALRHANRLFMAETRDYAALPSHLRPLEQEIAGEQIAEVRAEVLTTYAGRLFRDLLDRSHGNLGEALAIYKGGPEAPNRYRVGARRVGLYARKALHDAAIVSGALQMENRFGTQP